MQKRSRRAIIFLSLIIVILLLLQTPLLGTVRGLAWNMWLGVVVRVFNLKDLTVSENVTGQLQQLQAENIRLKAQLQQYQHVSEQVNLPTYDSFRNISGAIIGRPVDTFRTELVVNRGAADGVTVGAPVVVYGSTLLGFVTEVHEHSAIFRLLVHPSTSLPAQVVTDNAPQGLLVGQRYTSLLLTTIPRDSHISEGQEVVTISSETIPTGLRIGTIATIRNEENEAYQEAIISMPYDLAELKAVNVLVLP